MKSPCLGCTERAVGCHSKCDRYIAYDEENKARREEKLELNKLMYDWKMSKKDAISRMVASKRRNR